MQDGTTRATGLAHPASGAVAAPNVGRRTQLFFLLAFVASGCLLLDPPGALKTRAGDGDDATAGGGASGSNQAGVGATAGTSGVSGAHVGGASGTNAGEDAGASGSDATAAGNGGTSGGTNSGGRNSAGTNSGGTNSGGTNSGGINTGGANSGAGGTTSGGSAGTGGAPASGCIGATWPTADPSAAGPFSVAVDKNVGPLAGVVPDPVYGDQQQKFNVYRPKDLAQGGYCHPILVWANAHGDNPEPNPPACSSPSCGSYLVLMDQLASHGFVVIAALSTVTSQGTPLPTIAGLDWLITQEDDPTSPYYHRLDTSHIGALGHSEGGLSTSKAASDPRFSATATVSGAATIAGIHAPALWFCGGQDTVFTCPMVKSIYSAITTQPAMFIDNLDANHSDWLYQTGIKGPDIIGLTAWFRVHLMGDTANRKMFYGASCTFCTDSRVQVEQNSLMAQ